MKLKLVAPASASYENYLDEFLGFGGDAEDRADQEIGAGWDPETIGLDIAEDS